MSSCAKLGTNSQSLETLQRHIGGLVSHRLNRSFTAYYIMTTAKVADDQDLISAHEEIAAYKWRDTFSCRKCGNEKFFEGKKPCSRRCSKCKTLESVTAHTAFHSLRMPLPVALDIIKQIAAGKTRPVSYKLVNEVEEKYGIKLRQKTYWDFIKKIMLLTAEERMFCERLTVFKVKYGSHALLLFKGKTDNGEKYFACFCDGGDKQMYKIIEKRSNPNTIIVICDGEMKNGEYIFEFVTDETNGYDITKTLRGLLSWLTGIHPAKYTQDNIQMYLDAFTFAKNGNDYDDLMNRLTGHHI